MADSTTILLLNDGSARAHLRLRDHVMSLQARVLIGRCVDRNMIYKTSTRPTADGAAGASRCWPTCGTSVAH